MISTLVADYLRTIAGGSLFSLLALIGYLVFLLVRVHQRAGGQVAIGLGALQAYTLYSPTFWLVLCAAFGLGAFLAMRFAAPVTYRQPK